ncbi:hypothetical protein [Chromobacterium violaceum]|uniref:hypothetical protein n=1 Tax=Chromobacterium violaceum TaxID=536 RepID=UPI00143D8082|nr:hypothetical protein [Chromobacterium violaceum]QIY81470.1 hypothetical protein FOB43_20870 [Chromobacterium violaceum]
MSRKRTARKVWQLPQGIPGLPVGAAFSPTADRCQSRSIKRLLTAARPAAEWTPHDVNELIFLANTCSTLLRRWPQYDTPARHREGNDMVAVLAEVKRRRQQHGHYGVTGDEWAVLRRTVTSLQCWLETVPTQRLFAAEAEVERVAVADDIGRAA